MATKRKTPPSARAAASAPRPPVRVERGAGIDVEALRQIVDILEASEVTRLVWTKGDEKLVIRRREPHAAPAPVTAAAAAHAPHPAPAAAPPPPPAAAATPPPAAPAPAAPPPPAAPATRPGHLVTSPFVGTFYRSPSPEQPMFVEEGSLVKKGQTLCIIEAMKLMNEIESEFEGRITEILVENGSPVEFGQALFRIEKV
jgi:acetyl-CoA carboxylase biotin carboxyl carrier protein